MQGAKLDKNSLNRDEIATVHMYTQEDLSGKGQPNPPNIYRPLNRALRNHQFDLIRAFWLYITLLQSVLLKLPPATDQPKLYRGLVNPQPPVTMSNLLEKIEDLSADVWWAFSSTTTSKNEALKFCQSQTGNRVLYTMSNANARSVKEYSAFPKEDELLLPCGTAFATADARYLGDDATFLTVSLEQTETRLLQAASKDLDVHRHPELAQLAEILDRVETDFVGRRYDFHQPLPAGLLAIVVSRCAAICDEHTSIWYGFCPCRSCPCPCPRPVPGSDFDSDVSGFGCGSGSLQAA